MAILGVQNLKKHFDSTEVLRGIDFSLERGEVLYIIGSLIVFFTHISSVGAMFAAIV